MNLAKAVVFDLDGTLIDSLPDLAGALNRSLARHGQGPIVQSDVAPMVGDGAKVLLQKGYAACGLSPTDEDEAIFLADYEAHVTDLTEPFPGIPAALTALRDSGYRLAVCTNKPEVSARKVLAALDLEAFFDVVIGGDATPYRKPDPRHLQAVLNALDVTTTDAVMVGDHINDMKTAAGLRVEAIFVTWGYGRTDAMTRVDQAAQLPALVDRLLG
ncbi:HAD family hydrolase [Acidiphilium acidophilum]|uniref:phosphoglycolate phosphatase n=1 Tax=Acidiphilium acidophilum TaxID=76588 RepID=A0AAW9DQP2_ACIAO|nr:HAD-IIIA family hydrolase [Acidiphilium acidophilum]MDX5931315.1 HAD-IIIA family hydrolase [Acidiphilium acidophilum]